MKEKEVADIIFVNDKKEILLQKRGQYSKHGEDVAFFGGGVEYGENCQQALVREIKEELDLELNINDCLYVGEFFEKGLDGNTFIKRCVYLQQTNKKVEDFNVLEGDGADFASIQYAKKMKFLSDVTHVLESINESLSKTNK